MALPSHEYTLTCPPLDELRGVLEKILEAQYREVSVVVVDCPDLTREPWLLAAPGLCGNTRLVEVGSPSLLCQPSTHGVTYNFQDVAVASNLPSGYFLGAGAASFRVSGQNAELMPNFDLATQTICSKSAKIDQHGHAVQEDYPSLEVGPLCNLFGSDGKPGPVLQVTVKHRTGEDDFIGCIRRGLAAHYGASQPIGVGGVFRINTGDIHAHVMPDFSAEPLDTDQQVQDWLKWFTMHAPLTCLSTLVTDNLGTDFRLEHTHFFSAHGQGGHYHYDLTPEHVEYHGYFMPCERIFRVAKP